MKRRPSEVDRAMQAARIAGARRMTPENRLLASVNLAQFMVEIQRAGRRARESKPNVPS